MSSFIGKRQRLARRVALPAGFLASLAAPAIVYAQESVIAPPPALEFPTLAPADAPMQIGNQEFRIALEVAADLALCEALMTIDGKTFPNGFKEEDCTQAYKDKVANGEGMIRWASGMRPMKCKMKCVGPMYMSQSYYADQPNLRHARFDGRLKFVVSKARISRDVVYPFTITATCEADDGVRTGDLKVAVAFSAPSVGEPGAPETILDLAILPARISERVTNIIESQLRPVPNSGESRGPCRSVGANQQSNHMADSFVFERPAVAPISGGAASAMVGGTAKITFHRITRRALPPQVDASHANVGNPSAGYFTVYLNGAPVVIPSPSTGGVIEIDPAGGSAALNYCRTFAVAGADRLQIQFANGIGAAAWSEFPRAEKFGAGAPRTITTGRTIILPARQGPVDPTTGRPTYIKPQPITVREFDLLYTIDYVPAPTTVGGAGTSAGGGPGGGPGGGLAGGVVSEEFGDRPVLAEPGQPQETPCTPI